MLVMTSYGHAQDLEMLTGTAAEKEALASLDASKLIRAREQAEAILAERPSFIATYVRAYAYYEEEANHPRALFLMRRAESMLLDAFGDPPEEAEARRWHREILKDTLWILGEMDRREEQLAVLDQYDEHYTPPLEVQKIWPLLKLQRFDEARAVGEKLIYSDDLDTRIRAYNGLMAVGDETRDRAEAYRWGKEALERTQESSCIIGDNLARSALQNLYYQDAERYIEIARKASYQDCSANPYTQLTALFLLQGEFQKCVSTFETLRKEPPDPRMRVQFEMYLKGRFVELLYALGQFEEAAKRAESIINAPDRVGLTSASKENVAFAGTVLYYTVADAMAERERERASARSVWERVTSSTEQPAMILDRWEKRRIGLGLAAQQDLLVTALRPYYLDVMPWYAGSLSALLGPGVVRKAIDEARVADAAFAPGLQGYFDALEGEALWRSGEYAAARELAERALERLPAEARLLRWRTQTWLASILWADGQHDAAAEHFHEVLHNYPTALRHLGVALPAVIEDDGTALGAAVLTRLAGSPRLAVQESPFTVVVDTAGDEIVICLHGALGSQYACVSERADKDDASPPEERSERIAQAIDRFHEHGFAPQIELTQSDIHSLDGGAVRIDADRALQGILDANK